ncbi:MAG TPA: bifunctional folylpolyglutamate synthase/dihydrofolate synthase, partial [Clostridium sp.]|nr:bifunctional folylpolyglutamate synthase/dihydrofolate synthase [Clostridium sp.]
MINGEEIYDDAFARILTKTKDACLELTAEGKDVPTLFEVITGAAFLYF